MVYNFHCHKTEGIDILFLFRFAKQQVEYCHLPVYRIFGDS